MKQYSFDFVVIGSGLAGLTVAYHAARHGKVAIITKSAANISNSWHAQGGIAAAVAENDSPDIHFDDTIKAGRGLCDHDTLRLMVNEGASGIRELIGLGMKFDKNNGKHLLGLEGGHSRRRVFHAGGDATGKLVTQFMLEKAHDHSNITFFENTAAVRLIVNDNQCLGVQAFNYNQFENILFRAKATVMATGGLSRIYCRSTNPHTATGDGIFLAWDAGARLADMEFIQFHPTALSLPDQDAFLISEAVRGEGAYLLNAEKYRFMSDIHPTAELAPRDVVAYAIYKQMKKNRSDNVYISLAHLPSDKIKQRFSTIFNELKKLGYDLTHDLIPVAPAAHYMIGGIKTGGDGETNVQGLFACGEVASTGVMGANRLASNSLLECLVFGKRTAEAITRYTPKNSNLPDVEPLSYSKDYEQVLLKYRNHIAGLMSRNAGIVRNAIDLQSAIDELQVINDQFRHQQYAYNPAKIYRLSTICLLVAKAALKREESRGGHIREEFRQEAPHYEMHSIQQKNSDITYQPVIKDHE